MKIGITISNYYEKELKEIANLNNMAVTTICGLIVENFITFNKNRGAIPLFKQETKIVFAKSKSKKDDSDPNDEIEDDKYSNMSREELLALLANEEED